MPFFKFKAEKASGEIYESKRNAQDRFALYSDLKREGDTLLSAKEVAEKAQRVSMSFEMLVGRVSMHDKILLARNLGMMLSAGLALSRALSVIERQTRKKVLKKLVSGVALDIKEGKSLSEALKSRSSVFSELFVSMVRAGEESGNLPLTLKSLSDQMMSTYLLKKKIRGAMIYPAVIIAVIIVVGILMLTYVVPTLTSVFADAKLDLPWNTQIIISASAFIRDQPIMFSSVIAVAIASLVFFRRSAIGKRVMDTLFLRIPAIRPIVQEANSARTARTLSSLLSSGVEVVSALEITVDVVPNSLFKAVLRKAVERIKKGEGLSGVFVENENLYPPFMGEMVAIGEETGKISEMFANVADYYEEEVNQRTKDLSTIIEPALMIVIGAAVGFFAISVLGPMYSLVGTF